VRSRQSSLFRAQSIAEFALFDNDPNLFNTELNRYMQVTPAQMKEAVTRLLLTDNRVLLEIVPAPQKAPPATPAAPGESKQPSAPPPQVEPKPAPQTPQPDKLTTPAKPAEQNPAQPQQPTDPPKKP
jgi:outer membrane biosynthesis protein TonB